MSSSAQPLSAIEQNRRLIHRWFEDVWNQGRREVIGELLSSDCVLHDGNVDIRGPREFEAYHDALRERFSDIRITPGMSLCEGDLVALRWAVDCCDRATGKSASTSGISIVLVRDGRFVEAWQNWDAAGLAAQLSA